MHTETSPSRTGSAGRVLLALCGTALLVGITLGGDDPVRQGIRAYQNGEYKRAQGVLRPLFAKNPAYVDDRYGALAFWMGRTYDACNQPDSMRWAWRRGIRALRDSGRFDTRLFDAHLWAEWSGLSGEREELLDVYTALIGHVGDPVRGPGARSILRRHVAQLGPLLEDRQWTRILKSGAPDDPEEWGFRDGAGDWLVGWWRRQDPIPATAVNERLEEHLNRVQKAQATFSNEERLAGWDDRGDLFVRYGPPARRDSIPFMSARFHREVVRFGAGVHRADFPKNEIWSYPHVGTRGHYLFVRRKGAYQLGEALDLIPRRLKGNFHAADRSQNRAYSAIAALRYIYRHLAMHYNVGTSALSSDLEAYFAKQEALESILGPGPASTVGSGSGERSFYGGTGGKPPSEIAAEAVLKSEHKQRTFIRKREEEMPKQYSDAATAQTPLPVEVRTARFLEPDGTTRTELYWGGDFTVGELTSDRQVVSVSFVRHGPEYERRETTSTQYVFDARTDVDERRIVPEALTTVAGTDPYHLSVQWDRYAALGPQGEVRLGDRTGRQTIRVDSLRPLSPDPSRLEMSDLLPLIPSDGRSLNPARPREGTTPYPFTALTVDAPLHLYFEVYHLARNAQGRTHYEVSYEVRREVEDGGFLGLGGPEIERTETTSSYEGSSRRTTEIIRLDWGDAAPEAAQPVYVTVRIRDKVSGREVKRAVNFQLQPSSEAQ